MTCFINRTGEQATASATADSCGMTNKKQATTKGEATDKDIVAHEKVL
jgi:hypothetical protein